MIDLRSDTVTRPSAAMRAAMAQAEVGDDVFGDDPTVNRLQDVCAERFGMQSLLSDRTIEVDCTTLDRHFDGRFDVVDAIDVNVEGHDYQVLQGGAHYQPPDPAKPVDRNPNSHIQSLLKRRVSL